MATTVRRHGRAARRLGSAAARPRGL